MQRTLGARASGVSDMAMSGRSVRTGVRLGRNTNAFDQKITSTDHKQAISVHRENPLRHPFLTRRVSPPTKHTKTCTHTTPMSRLFYTFSTLLSVLVIFPFLISAHSIEVPAGKKECFFEDLHVHDKVGSPPP